ncbi:MAG: hypothetical protein Q9225_001889 [Loekoesia sp. 1 TL-2023]
MAEPFSTVAAVVSFADVTIRACKGIYEIVGTWKDTPNAIQRLQQTVQSLESMSGSLRLSVLEYESSKLFLEQHQLLPDVVMNELPNINVEIKFLQGCLPPAGTQGNFRQRIRTMIDEKKIFAVVTNLDRRQVAVMTALQIFAQRNAMQLYKRVSSIHGDLRQIDAATSSQLEGAKYSITRQLNGIAQIGSDAFAAQRTTLDSIHTLVAPIHDNHATIMGRLTTLQANSVDAITRILRAELKRAVIPQVEEYLNPYISSHNTQLDGIRRTLDQIVWATGHSSVDELAAAENKSNQDSATSFRDPELRDDVFYHQKPPSETMGQLSQVVRRLSLKDNYVIQPWTHSWS